MNEQKTVRRDKINRKKHNRKQKKRRNNHGEQASKRGDVKHRKIFVGGLPHNLTDKEFRAYFAYYGQIDDSVVMVDRATWKPRGFGFITYKDSSSVDECLKDVNQHKMKGKWIDCKRVTPKEKPCPTKAEPPKQNKWTADIKVKITDGANQTVDICIETKKGSKKIATVSATGDF